MTQFNAESLLAFTRARQKAVNARAEAARAKLGGETASHSGGNLSERLCEGLSAAEIEKDARSIKNILRVWKLTGKGGRGSTIHLPSGRTLRASSGDSETASRERAVMRTPKHLRPKRRKQG
jgi:hypothetical protein